MNTGLILLKLKEYQDLLVRNPDNLDDAIAAIYSELKDLDLTKDQKIRLVGSLKRRFDRIILSERVVNPIRKLIKEGSQDEYLDAIEYLMSMIKNIKGK